MRLIPLLSAALVATGSMLGAARAGAQATATGFNLDQFSPSERGSEWFAEDSLDLRGDPGAAVGIVGELAVRPLVIYNPDGSTQSIPVHDSLILHPGASVNLFDRVRLGLDVPVAVYQSGTGGTVDGVSYPAVTSGGVGDLRISADVRLFGKYGDAFTLAAGTQLFIPSGNASQYLGDNSFHAVLPRALVAGQIGWFEYAAHLGFHYRGLNTTIAGASVGSDVIFGASAGVKALEGHLLVGPELYGSGGVTGNAFSTQNTPVELLLGGHYLIGSSVRVGAGIAPGLTRAYGEPAVRYLASVEWVSSKEPPPDRDHDGILDADDACPDVPGVKTDDPKTNGCPPDRDHDGVLDADDACPDVPGVKTDDPKTNGCPPDRDHDGILDADDACPDVPGVKTEDPKTNGCPPDRDHDGIIDAEDACPDEPGVKTSDPKTNGCPPDPDRDKDHILNEVDACPDAPGPPNKDPKKNGCPAAAVVGKQIVILEQVKFATGSAAILPVSNGILNAVLDVLKQHPEIKHLRVEGHTDNVGAAAMNKSLSGRRAASVATWLIQHGLDGGRLSSEGFGMERPIDSNQTPEGRQNNRRVEFHIDDEPAK
jgi:outer membrane protein OmpA-like peptidoglycan-associated protein